MVGDRDLCGAKLGASRLHHYLRRELHPFAMERHLVKSGPRQRAETAVRVADLKPEEDVEYLRQYRIADAAVTPAHRFRLDLAGEPRAKHIVEAIRDGLDQFGDRREVIGVIGVAHDNDLPAGYAEPLQVGVSVAAVRLVDDSSPGRHGLEYRTISRSVVRDNDFAAQAGGSDALPRLAHANPNAAFLVEAWHNNADINHVCIQETTQRGQNRIAEILTRANELGRHKPPFIIICARPD